MAARDPFDTQIPTAIVRDPNGARPVRDPFANGNPVGPGGRPTPPVAAPVRRPGKIRTFTDSKGNIREVGTGRLIRAAKAKAPARTGPPKGKTYTDSQGVLRKVGGIAVNPLDQKVDAAILQETGPLSSLIGQAGSQFDAEKNALTGSDQAFASEMSALQQRIAALGAQQLGAGAAAAGGTATQQQDNLAYLKGLLGNSMMDGSGLGGGLAVLAAQAQGEGAGANAGLALGQMGTQNELGVMTGANGMRTGRDVADRMLAKNAAVKEYNDKIALAKSNRSGIKSELMDQELARTAARQEIRLSQAAFDREGQQYKDSLAQQAIENSLAEDSLAAETAGDAAKLGGVYGFGEAKDPLIAEVLKVWNTGIVKGTVKQPWRELWTQLNGVGGLNADQAALLATKNARGSIKNAKNGAAGVLAMLKERGVSAKVQAFIIKSNFGPGAWNELVKNPSQAGVPMANQPGTGSKPVGQAQISKVVTGIAPGLKQGSSFKVGNRSFVVTKVVDSLTTRTFHVSLRGGGGRTVTVTVSRQAAGNGGGGSSPLPGGGNSPIGGLA
jgi:hypothetical protein